VILQFYVSSERMFNKRENRTVLSNSMDQHFLIDDTGDVSIQKPIRDIWQVISATMVRKLSWIPETIAHTTKTYWKLHLLIPHRSHVANLSEPNKDNQRANTLKLVDD
jgi:hypothetical protein